MSKQCTRIVIWTLVPALRAVPAFAQNSRPCCRECVARNDKTVSSTTISRGWLQGDGFNRGQLGHGVDLTLKHGYLVQFTGGILTYAECSWTSTNGGGLDAARKAKGALAQKDVTSYSVASAPPSERDTTAIRVRVRFGQQGVLTVKGRVNGIVLYEVSELIGMFTEWPTGKIE